MKAIVVPPLDAAATTEDCRESVAYWLRDQGIDDVIWAIGTESADADATEGGGSRKGAATMLAGLRADLGDDPVLVVGLDLPCAFDLGALRSEHEASPAIATISLMPVLPADAAGNVEMDRTGRVLRLTAGRRGPTMPWINARVYLMEPRLLEAVPAGENWDLESGLFHLVLRSHGILGGHKIRQAKPLVPGPCGAVT